MFLTHTIHLWFECYVLIIGTGAPYGATKIAVEVASIGCHATRSCDEIYYGLINVVIISTGINPLSKPYYVFDGYVHLPSGLSCGMTIGIVGGAGVRYASLLIVTRSWQKIMCWRLLDPNASSFNSRYCVNFSQFNYYTRMSSATFPTRYSQTGCSIENIHMSFQKVWGKWLWAQFGFANHLALIGCCICSDMLCHPIQIDWMGLVGQRAKWSRMKKIVKKI